MNCKPPCLAIIVEGDDPRYLGRVVSVSTECITSEFGFHTWVCSPAHEGLGYIFGRPNDTYICDARLRQINGEFSENELYEDVELTAGTGIDAQHKAG